MPNNNGTQTVADEKQAIAVVDHEACGPHSAETPGGNFITRRKKVLVVSAAVGIAAAATYFAWNAFHYEGTDTAEVRGHIMPVSARINGNIKDVYVSEGQLVHAGEVLVTIDTQDYKIAEELAQLNLSEELLSAESSHRNVSADAEVARRYLQLAQAELNLSYAVIFSPVTGIVGKRSVEIGQNVTMGQEVIDVVGVDDLWVTANFKETQLAHLRPGQPVEIKVDAYGRKWHGRVTNLGGGTVSVLCLLPPEKATGNYAKVAQRVPVRIDFDDPQGQKFNAEGLLKPGLSVEPKVRVR
jgi:multidrug resistance efflux pump